MTRYRAPLGLFVFAAFALMLAYQIRTPITLDMSAASSSYLIRGFYTPEQSVDTQARWTNGDGEIRLPGLGSGVPLYLKVRLHEFRPSPLVPQSVTLSINDRTAAQFAPGAALASYDFDLPVAVVNLPGDLVIRLKSDTFIPKQSMGTTDERTLGVFVRELRVAYGPGFIIPPLLVWALLVISVMLIYGTARVFGWRTLFCLCFGLVILAAELVSVADDRLRIARDSFGFVASLLAFDLIALRIKRSQPSAVSSRLSATVDQPFTGLLLILIAWRIALVIVPIVGADIVGVRECCPQVDPVPLTSVWQAATDRWYRWDALWYGSVAQNGYQYFGEREASNVAFFPLFPLVNRLAMHVTALPVQVSGPLVSSLLLVVACWLLYRLTERETRDADTASRSVVYLLAFPVAYYLAIGYSETLYLLCILAAFWLAREGRWGWSGLAAFAAGLTRLHGALLIIPLGYEYCQQRGFRLRDIHADVISLMGGPLGVIAFTCYLGLKFGQPMAYFQIQALFFRGIRAGSFPALPGVTFVNYLHGLFGNVPSTESVIETGALLLVLVLTLEAWVRLPRVYGLYMLTFILFSLFSGDLISLPRFVLPMFPSFMTLALIGRRSWVDRAILMLMIMAQGILALLFSNGYWVA